MDRTKIYTDGACSGNPGKGGWAYIVIKQDEIIEKYGFENETTNNRMELIGTFMALNYCVCNGIQNVEIYSDSAYVVNAFKNKWLENWKANGWRKKDGKAIKNKEIWKSVYKLLKGYDINVKFTKVKAHSGNTFNEKVDKLAKKAIENNK